jgi:hypothetical protein
MVDVCEYLLATDSSSPAKRFRSVLLTDGGDDFYGVIRSEVLRKVAPHNSYHHAERAFVAELALRGPFHQVPELLYFRRDHPHRAERACSTTRSRSANMDPRRADRIRHPVVRLHVEYVLGLISAIRRAPLSVADRRACYGYLWSWFRSRLVSNSTRRGHDRPRTAPVTAVPVADPLLLGREQERTS